MHCKRFKKLKFISFFCIIILILEILYVGYMLFFKGEESLYFDGINAIDANDKYYVTVGSNNDNDHFYEKAKVSLYNKKKEKTFEKLYNIGFNSAFFGVVMDDDSIISVGSYEKNEKEHDDSIRRALIVKYDLDGNVLVEEDFQVLDNSKFTSVAVLEDGYLVTGQSVYKNTRIGSEEGGAILVKYDKDLNLLWSKTYGSSKAAIYNDLLIVGDAVFTVGTDLNHIGILCKYDLDGNLLNYNDYKYTDDIGFSGIVNIDDILYVSGSNRGDNTTNAMIVEYDLDCTYIDQVVYQGEGTIRYNKLIKDNHDNLIAIGILTTKKSADVLNYDGIIGKYSSSLKEINVISYGDERDDYFTDIILDNGSYLVVGYSLYEDGSYLSKFIRYSDALKVLGVE